VSPWISEPSNLLGSSCDQLGFAKFVYKSHLELRSNNAQSESIWFLTLQIIKTITVYFFQCRIAFSEHAKSIHLVEGVLFADLAHGKTDVDQHPVSQDGPVILQQSKIYSSSDSHHINEGSLLILGRDLDDLSRYG